MKKTILVITFLTLCTSLLAQDDYRTKKYKGFAEIGLAAAFMGGDSSVSFSFTTSHGYQFCPYFFLGAGLGVGVSGGSDTDTGLSVPIFGQTRVNFTSNRINPFLDVKGGYDVGDAKGGVISPTLGVSMPISYHCAIDFGLSYTCKVYNYDEYIGWHRYSYRECLHTISLGFGFEF